MHQLLKDSYDPGSYGNNALLNFGISSATTNL